MDIFKKKHAPIDQIVNVSKKIKMRMSLFTDYNDVFITT